MSLTQSKPQDPAVNAADLLTYDNRRLRQFLKEHDINSLRGVLKLSKTERSQLAEKIRDSKQFDANELSQRLADAAATPSRYTFNEYPRSPTESTGHSPLPDSTRDYEDLCRQELVEDHGHPVGTEQELLQVCDQPETSCNAIHAWLSDGPATETGARELRTVFSRQLERWWEFRISQWNNRADDHGERDGGKIAFAAYLGAKTRIYKGLGAEQLVSDESYEDTILRQWQALSAFRQRPEEQSFAAYKDTVRMRIGRHQFKRGWQMEKDVRQQDGWATLLEYLNFETRHWEQLHARAESLQPAFFEARRLLSEGLNAAQAERDACKNIVAAIREAVGPYLKAQYAAYRQKLRVDWVVELAHKMETEIFLSEKNRAFYRDTSECPSRRLETGVYQSGST
ncbi:protein kinase [Cordyceps javanica]|nr:protein kinase [Cordyceps javanica]